MATVAISTSESPDMRVLGLGDEHLRNAMADIAVHLLASGRSLAYGGDLRAGGLAELLFDLLVRYRGHPNHEGRTITVTDYMAWPEHIRMKGDDLTAFANGCKQSARVILLARDGTKLTMEQRKVLKEHEPDDDEWMDGLTAMRSVMRAECHARVFLGGRVEGYRGRMPGIAEEALLSFQYRQPVFLLGGFGGCTRDIAETIGLVDRWTGPRLMWKGSQSFKCYSPSNLQNGLSYAENVCLALTPHIDQAIELVSKGLDTLPIDPES